MPPASRGLLGNVDPRLVISVVISVIPNFSADLSTSQTCAATKMQHDRSNLGTTTRFTME